MPSRFWRLSSCPCAPPSCAASAAPDRERLRAYGLRDAARLARARGLSFPANATMPDEEAVRRSQVVLANALERGCFEDVALAAGTALWSDDVDALNGLGAGLDGELWRPPFASAAARRTGGKIASQCLKKTSAQRLSVQGARDNCVLAIHDALIT